MSKLETNTIDTVSGSTDLQLGSTNATIIKANDKILFNNSGDGIYLGVTSATASNLLNDYEEGTWTPNNNGDSTGVLSNASGFYRKVGSLVTITFSYSVATNFTGFRIGGLPFTPLDIGPNFNGGFIYTAANQYFIVENHTSTLFNKLISTNADKAITDGCRCTLTYMTN